MRRLAPVAVPFALAVVLFAPATLGGRVLSASDQALFAAPFPPQPAGARPENPLQFDATYVFEPDGLVVRRALRQGRLPVWTQTQSAGVPLLADQQSAPLFPLTWIGVVFSYWRSLAWIAVLKIAIAALGTLLLARALALRRAPALLAGIAFGFGTYLIVWLSHPHANAYVLLPWLFLFAELLCSRGRVRDAGALAAAVGLAGLGGQPESALIVSLATAAWVAYRLVGLRPPRREAARRAALAAGAGVLGTALAAVMILPFLEALHQSSHFSRSQPPLSPKVVGSVFFPEYWGRPDRSQVIQGPANFTERTLYLGVLPTLLAAAGLAARRPRGPQLFFAGLVLVALAIAVDTGPLAHVARHLPVLREANLNRLLALASFGIAMLAGFGLERLLSASASERKRMLAAAALVGLLPPLLVVGAHLSWLGDLPRGVERLLGHGPRPTENTIALASILRWAVFAAVGGALLTGLALGNRRRELVAAAAVSLAALDLILMGFGYNPAIPKDRADPGPPPAISELRRLTAHGGRVVGIGGLIPNSASRWGLHDARGHEHPLINRTSSLWYALGGGTGDGTVAVAPANPLTPKLLDVFGVHALLLDPRLFGRPVRLPSTLRRDRLARADAGGLVLENPSALPDAFMAYRWRATHSVGESQLALRIGTVGQARDEPAIETAAKPPAGRAPAATPARVVSRSDTQVTLDVLARAPGQLVLLDTFYPGWRARVDGRPAPIQPADVAFRSVQIRRGHHRVRFSYHPASVVAGGIISLAAALAIALCLLLGGRRRSSEPTASPRASPPVP
jgi:hypothetical protein